MAKEEIENKINTIFEKLSIVQNELKAPKGQKNKFGNYNYRSAEDILEALKPLLKVNRLSLVLSDELVVMGENNPVIYKETYYDKDLKKENERTIVSSASRFYIKATATIYDLDSEQTLSNTAYAREEESKKGMDGSQITGTASSYARKYALNGLFNIDDTKDADTYEYQKQTNQTSTNIDNLSPTDIKKYAKLKAEFDEYLVKSETDLDKILQHFKVMDSTQLSFEQLEEAIKIMAQKIKPVEKSVF